MRRLTKAAAAATVFSAAMVIAATVASLSGWVPDRTFPSSLVTNSLFILLSAVAGIVVLLQWYLWIAMLTTCVQRKQFAWGFVVLFGLSWGAAAFFYLRHRDSHNRPVAAQ